jgi:hypothetical protein
MTRRLVLLAFLSAQFFGCQDYPYEEVQASVTNVVWQPYEVTVSAKADILFVVDNSGSMAGEQRQLAESFREFTSKLEEKFGEEYHIAIVTTGMESDGCPQCSDVYKSSCINPTGENGRFQDRVCTNVGTDTDPDYECRTDSACRVVSSESKSCFYDPLNQEGTVFVGVDGCGFERGLAPMRVALRDLAGGCNAGFLRKDAMLVVVVISDEEDCGEVGDVYELTSDGGNVCNFAAKGVGPEGETSHIQDPQQRSYTLTPVEEYYDFLVDEVKDGEAGMVKFAAIVGVKDVHDLSTTTIEYQLNEKGRWDVVPACRTPGCEGIYCEADPGTRYIKLAQLFGENGRVDTICQNDFSMTMQELGTWVGCPLEFKLGLMPLDPDLANILIDGREVPRYTCSIEDREEPCGGPGDVCPAGSQCVETWAYCPKGDPDPRPECLCSPYSAKPYPDCTSIDFEGANGGVIVFADHYDPCKFIKEGTIEVEFFYVPDLR